jgi:hypothetical protein
MLTSSGVRARIAWSKQSERRTRRRLRPDDPNLPAQLVAVVGGDFWEATVRDVSSTGIKLLTHQHFEPGMLLTIDLTSKDGRYGRTALGWIVHVTPNPKGEGYLVGCSFTAALSEDELRKILF